MCVWGSHKIRVWCKSSRSLSLPVQGKTATWKGWMGRLWARVFIYEKIQSSVIAPILALIINQLSCTANAVWYQVSKSIYKKGWKQCWFLWAPNVVWIWTIRNGLTLWCLFSGYWQCLGRCWTLWKMGSNWQKYSMEEDQIWLQELALVSDAWPARTQTASATSLLPWDQLPALPPGPEWNPLKPQIEMNLSSLRLFLAK